jgi:RND family efflux transporter MFP subunit
MRTVGLALPLLLAALATDCAKKEGEPEKAKAEVRAEVAAVTAERFSEVTEAVGTVTARVGHVASLAAPAPTRVAKVFIATGAEVKVGDALVEFERAPFEAAATGAEAALQAAERGAERAKRLADAGVGPRKDAEQALAELAAAQSNAVTARRAKELATLRSPIAGVVTRLSAVLGASADAGQPLVEVSDPSIVDVVVALDPAAASRVQRGQSVSLFAGAAAEGAPIGGGTVADVAMAVDTASRGVSVRVTVDHMTRPLRFGETFFARIAVADHPDAVVVPVAALVPSGEGFRVFVVDEAGVAHAREVKVGARSDRGIWVREGLKPGEQVVTTGAYGMDEGAKVVGKEDPDEKGEKGETNAKGTKPGAKTP